MSFSRTQKHCCLRQKLTTCYNINYTARPAHLHPWPTYLPHILDFQVSALPLVPAYAISVCEHQWVVCKEACLPTLSPLSGTASCTRYTCETPVFPMVQDLGLTRGLKLQHLLLIGLNVLKLEPIWGLNVKILGWSEVWRCKIWSW